MTSSFHHKGHTVKIERRYNDLGRYVIEVIIDDEDFTDRLLNQNFSATNFAKAMIDSWEADSLRSPSI